MRRLKDCFTSSFFIYFLFFVGIFFLFLFYLIGNTNAGLENAIALDANHFFFWDGEHYKRIATQGYGNGEFIYSFAFFPLFPWYLNLVGTNSILILFTNLILVVLGSLLILKAYKAEKKSLFLYVLLVLPSFSFYLLPYAEALFFFLVSLVIYGIKKDNYWIYFVGMFLASCTKSLGLIFFAAFIPIALYFILFSKVKILHTTVYISKLLLPILLGIGFVFSYFYYLTGDFLISFKAQAAWGGKFQIPKQISDWSYQGFSMNIFIIFLILLITVFFIFRLRTIFMGLKTLENKSLIFSYIVFLYFLITILYRTFFYAGSINGISRYIAGTPFFIFFVYELYLLYGKKILKFLIPLLLLSSYYFLDIPYGEYKLRVPFLGFFLFQFVFLIGLLFNYLGKRYNVVLLVIYLIINAYWTAHMMVHYLKNDYIFT